MTTESSDGSAVLDIDGVMELLPHRPPFLLVDKILEIEDDERCVGQKNVTINEPFFDGHFPGHPVMPGVLIIEALAQVGAILLFRSLPKEKRASKLVYFGGCDDARFRRPVRPGDVLRLEMVVQRIRGPVAKVQGKASVDGELAAEALITSMMVDA